MYWLFRELTRGLPSGIRKALSLFAAEAVAKEKLEILRSVNPEASRLAEVIVDSIQNGHKLAFASIGRVRGPLEELMRRNQALREITEVTDTETANLLRQHWDSVLQMAREYGVFYPKTDYVMPRFADPNKVFKRVSELGRLPDGTFDRNLGIRRFAEEWQQYLSTQMKNPPDVDTLAATVENIFRYRERALFEMRSLGLERDPDRPFLPLSWFMHHRTVHPLPPQYRMGLQRAAEVYSEQLSDWIRLRDLEAALYAYEAGITKEQARRLLYEADEALFKRVGDLELGDNIRPTLARLRSKFEKDPVAYKHLGELLEVLESVFTRDYGWGQRNRTAELLRTFVPWQSGILAGISNLSQFFNTVAIYNRGLKMLADATDYVANLPQIHRAARVMGVLRHFWEEDLMGRRVFPEDIQMLREMGHPVDWMASFSATMRKWSDVVMKVSGLDKVEEHLRAFDVHTAYRFFKEGLEKQDKGLQAFMKVTGLTEEQIRRAVNWYENALKGVFSTNLEDTIPFYTAASYTQYFYVGAEFPVTINRIPFLEAMMQFRKFTYLQSSRFVTHVIDRATKGDLQPLITTLAVTAPVMYGTEKLRAYLAGRVWRAGYVPSPDGNHVVFWAKEQDLGDPDEKRGLVRRMNAFSPHLADALSLVMESGVFGVLGEVAQALATRDAIHTRAILTPVAWGHLFRWFSEGGQILTQIFGGDAVEAGKTVLREVMRTAGPVAMATLLQGRLPPLAGAVVAVIPRTLATAWAELQDPVQIRKEAREAVAEMFLQGNPYWVEVQKYLILRFGPDAAVTRRDILRKAKNKIIAAMGLTQSEFREKARGDEKLDDLVDEELDEMLKPLLKDLNRLEIAPWF